MSNVQTNWGYSVESSTSIIPSILDVQDFLILAPGLSSSSTTIRSVLDSVSSAVRDWCGWHVSPILNCTWTGDGEGSMLFLPVMGLRDIDSVTLDGLVLSDDAYEWRESGILRLTNGTFPDSWRSVQCTFTAGFDSSVLAQVVSQIALNALVAAPGVAEEHADGVGITYNRTGNGITGGVSLLERDKELLAPYRLIRAW